MFPIIVQSTAARTLLLLVAMAPAPTRSAIAAHARLPATVNRIVGLEVSCDSEWLNATVTMEQPFKGLLFAKDFAQDCKYFGNLSSSLSVSLPAGGCGLRLAAAARAASDGGRPRLFYAVTLVAQQDRRLRQAHDQERAVRCPLPDGAFVVKSANMLKALRSAAAASAATAASKAGHRIGRMKDEGWSKELTPEEVEEQLKEAMSAARAWMEITPEKEDDRFDGTVQVGETAVLTIKSTLPAGIGWRVADCWAHDGLRADVSESDGGGGGGRQRLLDGRGCPAEEGLLPAPRYAPARAVARMRHQAAAARFAAFKFPDRDRLHVACSLHLCRGVCPKVDCNDPSEADNRIGRAKKGAQGEILDQLEVFNSVEVLAPEIDDLKKSVRPSASPTHPFAGIPGDRAVCISAETMAVAFCAAGLVFLGAVVGAAGALLRARRRGACAGVGVPPLARSLLSSGASSAGSGRPLVAGGPPPRALYGRIP